VTRTEKAGLWFALAEVMAVGLVPAFSKYAVSRVDPLLYSALAVCVAAVVSIGLAAWRGELGQVVDRRFVGWLIPVCLLGTTATTLLLFIGSRLTDGVSSALLLQSEPVYSLALTWLVWRRPASTRQLAGTALILSGIMLVLYDGSLRIGLGGALILLAPLGWQISHVLALRVMPPMSPYALTAARYLYGGAGLVLTQALFGHVSVRTVDAAALAMAVFHGVVLFFFGTLLWYETIRRLDLARATAIVTPSEPIVSLVLVWLLLRTLPNAYQVAGLFLLAPGMWLVVVRSRRERDAARQDEGAARNAVEPPHACLEL
jgi:drug/metabolite transporter (DMT)-like permease